MGMKITTLKAVLQLIRSDSTAKIKSERRHDARSEDHPDERVLDRGECRLGREHRPVVVDPDEGVPAHVEQAAVTEKKIG